MRASTGLTAVLVAVVAVPGVLPPARAQVANGFDLSGALVPIREIRTDVEFADRWPLFRQRPRRGPRGSGGTPTRRS